MLPKFIVGLFIFVAIASAKTVTVFGSLQCKCDQRYLERCQTKSTVELMEDDDGPSHDDLLASAQVPLSGAFNLTGTEYELFEIEPYLLITHYCPDGVKKQKRINLQPVTSEKTYDLGTIPLADWNDPKYGK